MHLWSTRVIIKILSTMFLCEVDKLKLSVDRVIYGSLMTSLEMAGVSLTLLKMEHGWDYYLGESTYIVR